MLPASLRLCRPRIVATAATFTLLGIGCTDTTAVDRTIGSGLSPRERANVVTPAPSSVVVAGSLQSELGCSGDWDPACSSTGLTYDANDDAWQGSWTIPAGSYEYKAALNGSWDENYGAGAQSNGADIPLVLAAPRTVKFYYDHKSHWITDDASSVIAVAAGNFQSELGCSGDWQPDCLRSWLEDADGDGIYTLSTTVLAAGSYETKVAISESWTENYGAGGAANGANIGFTVPQSGATVDFAYDAVTHVLSVTVTALVVPPTSVTVAGSLQSEVGCSGDWQPDCATTHLTYDASDDVWQGTWAIPAGSYEYKAALDDSWDENYGLGAQSNGANIPLTLAAPTSVKFYYDPTSHWITDNVRSTIVTAAGNFQSELGCSGDWQPDCLRSWLEDPDGDGVFTFTTTALPAASYETKAAIDESWDENYGANGVANGANIPFTVTQAGSTVDFSYDGTSHVLTITVTPPLAAQSITITSSLPSSGVVGATFTLSATGGGSGNPVLFATQTSATCTTSGTNGTKLTLVAAGTCTVEATQAGSASYAAATPVTLNLTVTTVSDALGALRSDVAASGIKASVRTGLTDKLDAALLALGKGNIAAACKQLSAFESQVRSQRGKAIPVSSADAWLAESSAIRGALGC